MGHLAPWIKKEEDIWGQEDIELALLRHPDVERAHVKLWIAGAGQLSAQVNGAIWERSRQLAVDIDAALPRYVETGVLTGAMTQLEKNRVLIVSGPPGVGKTTVAQLLVAQAVLDGYEPISCMRDVTWSDLYKHAFRLTPLIGSELVADAFELAWDIRILDMRAAPYDFTGITLDPTGEPWTPIAIETAEGEQEYVAQQRDLAERAAPIRQRLTAECARLLEVNGRNELADRRRSCGAAAPGSRGR